MYSHMRGIAATILFCAALHGADPTEHDAPVKGGNKFFWLSLDQSITQSPAPLSAAEILQHTHHGANLHKLRIYDTAGATSPVDFNAGDRLLVFFQNETTPSVIISAEKGVIADFPLHAGHRALLCGAEPGVACRPTALGIRALQSFLQLTDSEVSNPTDPAVIQKALAYAERLTHVWRFKALNNGTLVRTMSEAGRVAYFYQRNNSIIPANVARMVMERSGGAAYSWNNTPPPACGSGNAPCLVADRLYKRKCWFFEISYPQGPPGGSGNAVDVSPAAEELRRLKAACRGCFLWKCKICPSELYKPSMEPYRPGAPAPHPH